MAATEITLSSALVLDAARDAVAVESAAIIRKLEMAVEWVLFHPGEEVDTSIEWGMRDLEIAGGGAPSIDEGAVAEFALAIGASAVLARCSFAQIDRTVEAARAEYDPEAAEERRKAAAEQRHVDVHLDKVSPEGLVHIDADVDHADALAFNDLIAAKAAGLDQMLPLDVRRAMAIGMLGTGDGGTGVQREIVIYADTRPDQAMVDVENTRTVITPQHLRDWCQQAGTRVTVRPVIDLNAELSTDVHMTPPRP